MYTIERSEKTIKVNEYIENYVNVEEFLEYCKECKNYKAIWSCPSYNFNPEDYKKELNTFLDTKIGMFENGTSSKSLCEWMKTHSIVNR